MDALEFLQSLMVLSPGRLNGKTKLIVLYYNFDHLRKSCTTKILHLINIKLKVIQDIKTLLNNFYFVQHFAFLFLSNFISFSVLTVDIVQQCQSSHLWSCTRYIRMVPKNRRKNTCPNLVSN